MNRSRVGEKKEKNKHRIVVSTAWEIARVLEIFLLYSKPLLEHEEKLISKIEHEYEVNFYSYYYIDPKSPLSF